MRPVEYSFYPDPVNPEMGLLHCVDESGDKWTLATEDISFHRMLIRAARTGAAGGLAVAKGKYPLVRAGWPDDWN